MRAILDGATTFWKWTKYMWVIAATLGGAALSIIGLGYSFKTFVGDVSAERMNPRVEKIEQAAILNMKHVDTRFNTLEKLMVGRVVTPPSEQYGEVKP